MRQKKVVTIYRSQPLYLLNRDKKSQNILFEEVLDGLVWYHLLFEDISTGLRALHHAYNL